MVKIKLNLFESIVGAIFLPNIGFLFTTIFLIISLISPQEMIVYKGIMVSYTVCLCFMVFSLLLCFLINKRSTEEFVLFEDSFEFLNTNYLISQISSCEYYVCKWYALPIAIIYKEQAGGLITMKLNTGKRIQFKVLYKDYLKIKKQFNNTVEIIEK